MSDFTVNDTMAEIRYELDDREIYNDIRSEIGILITETIIDADPTYQWQGRTNWSFIYPDGITYKYTRTSGVLTPIAWELYAVSARTTGYPAEREPYYNYEIHIETTSNPSIVRVEIKNTGTEKMLLYWGLKYKYLATEGITHEEQYLSTLKVRAVNASSIMKYGRRVMNLTWAEGTEEQQMQSLVNSYITRYAEPIARLIAMVKGITDVLRTQIITREISDLLTVVCTELGLNADCFINSISISEDPTGIPVCKWGLEIQRAYELLTLFTLDTSELDGAHILGS